MATSNLSKKLLPSLFCFISIVGFKLQASARSNGGSSASCNTNLREILPPPYSDLSSLACSLIWEQEFSLSFFQDSQNVTTIVLSGRHEHRWIGIGFSRDGTMVGSSAIVAWIERDGVSGIRQYYLQGKQMSDVLPNKGELRFTTAMPVVVAHGDLLYIAFQLQFATSLAYQPILIAKGSGNPQKDGSLPKHVNSTTTYIEFSTVLQSGQPLDPKDLRRYHGATAIIGWGILTPAGLLIARYFRHLEPLWYYLHSSTHFFGFFVGIFSMAIGRHLYEKIGATFVAHRFIGFTVFFLTGLEVFQFIGRPSNESRHRQYWNFAHYWLGRTAMVLGVSNIFVGFYGLDVDRGLKISFLVAFVALWITVIVFEVRLRRKIAIPVTIDVKPPVFRVDVKLAGGK